MLFSHFERGQSLVYTFNVLLPVKKQAKTLEMLGLKSFHSRSHIDYTVFQINLYVNNWKLKLLRSNNLLREMSGRMLDTEAVIHK